MKTKKKKLPGEFVHEHGQLRVWWVPQMPMRSFNVDVRNIREARLILNVLADYDQFQLDNNVKPEYSNAGGLQVWHAKDREWIDFYDSEAREWDDIPDDELDSTKWEHATNRTSTG